MASIQRRDNGQWRARYRDDAGREHARHFSRKIDAQRWLDETTTALITSTYVDPRQGRVTFADYFTEWAQRQVWAPNTAKGMRLAATTATFADTPLRMICRSHVEQWVKGMTVGGLAPGTVDTRFRSVRAVFRAAVRDKVIATDPTEGVVLPRKRRAEVAMMVPATEQVGAILAAAEPSFRPLVGLCAFAGLRLGEAAAVQLGDVDFLRRVLTVSRQVQRGGGGTVEVRSPKSGSERVVFLAGGLVEMLSRHVEVGVPPEGWLFVGPHGGPPDQNAVHWRWRQTLAAAGLDGVRLHDLRHFYASGLIAAGCDVVTVQRALGHSTATTTLSTHAHLWPSAEDRTRQAAAAMLTTALAAPADSVRTSGTIQATDLR